MGWLTFRCKEARNLIERHKPDVVGVACLLQCHKDWRDERRRAREAMMRRNSTKNARVRMSDL
jgi:hypothetical protein